MQLKQLYLAKRAAVVSALMSAPSGVAGQDYAQIGQRAAELKAEGLKQAELKDPKHQSSLAEYNELMLKAVACRRTLDGAKLRQDKESVRRNISPPPAPAAVASSEAPPAHAASAPAVISPSLLHLSSPSVRNAWFATILPGGSVRSPSNSAILFMLCSWSHLITTS